MIDKERADCYVHDFEYDTLMRRYIERESVLYDIYVQPQPCSIKVQTNYLVLALLNEYVPT
jgi:hypothetical protein